MKSRPSDRVGIDIGKAKKIFKVFLVITIIISIIITPFIFYFYYYNCTLICGGFTGIMTLLLVISHFLYVRSRDKLQIIDYYSLKYYTQKNRKFYNMFRYFKAHFKSLSLMIIAMITMQITWSFTIAQLTNIVSFSVMGFFFMIERLPFELRFKSYQRNAILDSIRSDEQLAEYNDKIKQLGWNDKNKKVFKYYLEKIDKEIKIKKNHDQLLMRTTIIYNVTIYVVFAIFIEVIGLISWSQWLKLLI